MENYANSIVTLYPTYLLVLFLLGPGFPLDLFLLDLLELLGRGLLGHLQHVAERGANHHHLRPLHHTQLPQAHLILRQAYVDQRSKYEQLRQGCGSGSESESALI